MSELERVTVYRPERELSPEMANFREATGNQGFRQSRLTAISLLFLLLIYPGYSVGYAGDPTQWLKAMNEGALISLLVTTISIQWMIFLMLYVAVFREQTGFRGLGFTEIKLADFGLRGRIWLDLTWAGSFLLVSNLILSGLAWFLAQIGLPMSGEIALLIPEDTAGRVVWVLVSITAGVCEETAFRGYLMTRMRLVGNLKSWLLPVIISALVFGACHAYQGWPGFILISVYGVMFSLLYIRTGRIWPCIFAHFFQDFGALFFPQ